MLRDILLREVGTVCSPMNNTPTKERRFAGARPLSRMLNVSEATVRKNFCYGRWPYYKVGRRTVADVDEILKIVESTRREAVATK